MAHIIEFSIEGLAGRKKAINVKLNRDINVFFGLNGSGKSSLLKILHSAMSEDTSILKDVPFTEARVVMYSKAYDKNFEYKIKRGENLGRSNKVSKSFIQAATEKARLLDVNPEDYKRYMEVLSMSDQLKWNVSPKTDGKSWRHSYLPISRLYVGDVAGKRESNTNLSEDQLDLRFSDILQQIWLRYSYGVNSNIRDAQEEGLANIFRELLSPSGKAKKASDNIPAEVALSRVKQFLSRQKKKVMLDDKNFLTRYAKESEMRNVVNDIDRVERNIEQAGLPIEKLNVLINKLFGYDKKVNLSGREIEIQLNDGTIISPQKLSSGEKHLLKLLIEVVAIGESTIIIDEPELSMHIDWQKSLLQDMNMLNPETQLIVASHSPEVMSRLDDSKIFHI